MSRGLASRRHRGRAGTLAGLSLALLLGACGDEARSDQARVPEAPAEESVERLLAEPAQLEAAQAQCREGAIEESDARCQVAAEAARRRFRGGGVTYTPKAVDPFPSRPEPAASDAAAPRPQDASR